MRHRYLVLLWWYIVQVPILLGMSSWLEQLLIRKHVWSQFIKCGRAILNFAVCAVARSFYHVLLVKRAVSRGIDIYARGVWPPRRRGDSGTANIAAPKDSTTRAAKDGPVWSHCSAPAVRYEGKCGADSAHANHSENEPSMKGLMSYTCALN